MPSVVPDFEYDIFISYRQKDNKVDGWVTGFVSALKAELDATLKNSLSIYFDENPHDGLLETHQVGASLEKKLRCVVFMPIVSQTYCDPASYAWQNEFMSFIRQASDDRLGLDITLANGNVASRVLPIQIHELDSTDRRTIESALGGPMRAVPFVYSSPGVNRPLLPHEEHPENNKNRTSYRDQINKVANALKEIGAAVQRKENGQEEVAEDNNRAQTEGNRAGSPWLKVNLAVAAILALTIAGYYFFKKDNAPAMDPSKSSIAVIPFRNNTGDPSMSHYGVGIASEVSTQLGLTKRFDFISSLQATIQYQQSDKSPAEIGEDLGVTHILTGMYQTAGNNMQVLVELIDAEGKVIWSIPYKTRYTDIFEVQQTIAAQVKDKFAISDAPETAIKAPDLEAYAHYIKGVEIAIKSNLPESRMMAIAEYQQAIALDSGFIEPWWGIIEEYCYYYWNRGPTEKITLEMIQPYMEYVEERFPNSWKKKAVKATYEYWALAHYQKALDIFLEVIQEAPQDGGVRSMASAIYRRQLNLPEAMKHLSVSLKQSPAGVIYWNELVALSQINGDYDQAIQAAATIYRLNESLSGNLYRLRQWTGTLDKLPRPVQQARRHIFQADKFLQDRDLGGLLHFVEAPDTAFREELRTYYKVVANYLLKHDVKAKKLGAYYLALKGAPTFRKGDVLAILGKQEEFIKNYERPGWNLEEDLSSQWNIKTENLTFLILSGKYEEATRTLTQINEQFPQVGDYGWLNLPIYNRIKQEYPPFSKALQELKLPPRLNPQVLSSE
jgi:TolB-like protein